MKIQEVIDALEMFAPLPLQESYDNAGLQVGLTEADCSGALLCLDVTEDVVRTASRQGMNLVVSHHPLLFHGLRQVCGADWVQRTVMEALRLGVTVVSMHTNLDNALGGVNHRMASVLGLGGVRFLGAERTVAAPRRPATARERLTGGSGVVGELPAPMGAEAFIRRVKELFRVPLCQTNAVLRRPVSRVALCGGAGAFMLRDAIAAGADAFVTGEMHYHEYFGHEQEIQIIVIGHYESEQYTTHVLRDILRDRWPELRLAQYRSTSPITCW